MTHNTGNPIGSTSPKDLSDNTRNLDLLLLGDDPSYPDRKGVPRKSYKEMEREHQKDQTERITEFNEFLENSGFEMPIDYIEGLSISRPTQIIRYDGELYRAKSASLPFSTTVWVTDSGRFFSTGDAVLRQELSTKVKSKRFEATATDDQGTPDALFRVSRTHTIGSSAHAFRDQTIFASNTADRAIASFDAALTVDSPLSVDHVIGFQARSTHTGSGTLNIQYGCGTFNDNTGKINLDYAFYNGNKFNGLVGECFGFYNRPSHFTNTITSYGFVHKPAIGSGATVTNSAGVRIETADGSGTLTNEFGIYVKNLTKGANRWPLYIEQQSGLAYVGAKLQVDQTLQVGGTAKLSIGGANGSDYPAIMYNHDPRLNQFINNGDISGFLWTSNNFQFRQALGGVAGGTPSFTTLVNIHTANDANRGSFFPGTTNTQNLGIAGGIWKEIFSGNPAINTSDERVKTEVLSLSISELAAAKQMAKEIGTFKFLEAVADKGDEARIHIGMTVQRAIQILLDFGLDPMTYSFICYDKWDETVVQHEALTIDHAAVIVEHDALYEFGVVVDADGYPIRQRVSDAWSEVVAEAWTETVREAWAEVTPAGDSYGFRATELLSFIAVGFEARLSAIELQLGLA